MEVSPGRQGSKRLSQPILTQGAVYYTAILGLYFELSFKAVGSRRYNFELSFSGSDNKIHGPCLIINVPNGQASPS